MITNPKRSPSYTTKYNGAMPASSKTSRIARTQRLRIAEHLRVVLSHWVRATRDQAGTPSSAKIETLRLLKDAGPLTIAMLAQRRAVKHQSMRLVVEQLAAEGAVSKAVDPGDRRNQIVSITNSGQTLLKAEQQVRTEWIAGLLQGCTSDELHEVAAALGTLEKLLERRATVV